jgi:multidrug efflux pump subunit AcrA (membrane-fusion protein)
MVEVQQGLTVGERVVTSGHTNLRPGARVRATEDETMRTDGGAR